MTADLSYPLAEIEVATVLAADLAASAERPTGLTCRGERSDAPARPANLTHD